MVSIKIKLIAVCLLIALIPLLVLGVINVNKTSNIVGESIEESLTTLVKAKEASLEEYITSTEKNAESFSETEIMQQYINYLNRELTEEESAEFKSIEKQVDNMLHAFMEAHWGEEYHHIYIADLSGTVVLSPNHGAYTEGSPSSHYGSDVSENEWFKKALVEPQVTDYFSFSESDHHHQILFYPVKDANGITKAVIGIELMISHETEILTENLHLGDSGRVFLTTLDGTPVVHLKDDKRPPIQTEGIQEAKENGFSTGNTINENGIEVIGFYLKNQVYPWIMVAEIETAEAFKNIGQIKSFLFTGLIATAIIVIILAIVLANYFANPIKKLSVAVNKISDGNFNVELPRWNSKDEIGELTSGMEMMLASIKMFKNKKK